LKINATLIDIGKSYLANVGEDNDGTNKKNGFFIHHIQFVRNSGSSESSAKESSPGLGDDTRLGREFVDDFICTLRRGRCRKTTAVVIKKSFPLIFVWLKQI